MRARGVDTHRRREIARRSCFVGQLQHLVENLQRERFGHDWDDDAEIGVGKIDRWNETEELGHLHTFDGTYSNKHTKGTPCLSADILDDWRRVVLWHTEDSGVL